MDTEYLWWPGKSGSDRVFAPAQRAHLWRGQRRHHDRRGIDRMADGLAADLCRRARLWFQMEPRLDARHDPLYVDRSDFPQIPAQRFEFRAALRLTRKFRPAVEPRRSCPWQRLANRQDARRPLAALCQSARLLRLHVDASGQKAVVYGQ